MKITLQTKLPFSKRYKGVRLRDLPDGFLTWMQENLRDTDFHDWAIAGEAEIERRKSESIEVKDLEEQADEFLRNAGYNPRKL
jgi:hypothetical protein